MTHTFTRVGKPEIAGTRRRIVGDLDITSYTASGEVLTPSELGMHLRIDAVAILGLSDNGHVWRYDASTKKIRAFKADTSEGTATIVMTDGRTLATEEYGNIKAGESANQVSGSGTAAAAGTEDIIALVTATTAAKSTIVANPDYPRNVVVEIESTNGGTLPADCGTATIAGTDMADAALEEIIALSPINSVVMDATANLWVVGAKVFKTVTSLTLSVDLTSSVADARVALGGGTKLGLKLETDTETEATAIHRVLKNDTDIAASTYVFDGTYNAVDLGADFADNDEVHIEYFVDSDAAGGTITTAGSAKVDVEASSTDDIGAVRVEVLGR